MLRGSRDARAKLIQIPEFMLQHVRHVRVSLGMNFVPWIRSGLSGVKFIGAVNPKRPELHELRGLENWRAWFGTLRSVYARLRIKGQGRLFFRFYRGL